MNLSQYTCFSGTPSLVSNGTAASTIGGGPQTYACARDKPASWRATTSVIRPVSPSHSS